MANAIRTAQPGIKTEIKIGNTTYIVGGYFAPQGVTVQKNKAFYLTRKRRKPFDRNALDGMTESERDDYMDGNVIALRKYYCVFNGDIIDGIPEREKYKLDANGKNSRAEGILQYWSDNESKIIYEGDNAIL